MLRRTGFKQPARPERKALAWPGRIQGGVAARITDMVVASPKQNAIEHEGYRRLVAALPCIRCGIWHQSQAAHPPPTGKGIKEDDRECFPLCCTRPLITGCHVEFDQYRLVKPDLMRLQAARWGMLTRARIMDEGTWPKGLPMFDEISL
jgi:hypothetical protein